MAFLSLMLYPIIEAMRAVLVAIHQMTGSYGIAIILLSLIVRLITAPIAGLAARSEERHRQVQMAMEPDLRTIYAISKGRERFERIEALYARHHYHPIKSAVSMLPLFLQIPFLLSALILLSDFAPLEGERFLLIADLLKPDGLLKLAGSNVNLLPLLIPMIALIESAIGTNSTRSTRIRFMVVTVVIVLLIYDAPAGVCLYWLTSNVASLARGLFSVCASAATKDGTER